LRCCRTPNDAPEAFFLRSNRRIDQNYFRFKANRSTNTNPNRVIRFPRNWPCIWDTHQRALLEDYIGTIDAKCELTDFYILPSSLNVLFGRLDRFFRDGEILLVNATVKLQLRGRRLCARFRGIGGQIRGLRSQCARSKLQECGDDQEHGQSSNLFFYGRLLIGFGARGLGFCSLYLWSFGKRWISSFLDACALGGVWMALNAAAFNTWQAWTSLWACCAKEYGQHDQ
jgi:hypothetical protein